MNLRKLRREFLKELPEYLKNNKLHYDPLTVMTSLLEMVRGFLFIVKPPRAEEMRDS